jgi:hypothetical protein
MRRLSYACPFGSRNAANELRSLSTKKLETGLCLYEPHGKTAMGNETVMSTLSHAFDQVSRSNLAA